MEKRGEWMQAYSANAGGQGRVRSIDIDGTAKPTHSLKRKRLDGEYLGMTQGRYWPKFQIIAKKPLDQVTVSTLVEASAWPYYTRCQRQITMPMPMPNNSDKPVQPATR